MRKYTPMAYRIIGKALKTKGSEDFWELFKEIKRIIREEKRRSPLTYMNQGMRTKTTGDIKQVIKEIEDGSVVLKGEKVIFA